MIKFDVETIVHSRQRYPTIGDYATDVFGVTHYKISYLNDWRYELLVAVHEIVESYLCRNAGISFASIDQFDIEFEKNRTPLSISEPGDSAKAPYHKQHVFATKLERMLAKELGVEWEQYEKTIDDIFTLYNHPSLQK